MGLLNKRNIAKAKALAEKNKDKIAENVTKATSAIDKKTGGKYTDKLKKVDDAANKYAGVDDTTDSTAKTDSTARTNTARTNTATTNAPRSADDQSPTR